MALFSSNERMSPTCWASSQARTAASAAAPHSPNDITKSMHAGYYGPARLIDEFPQPHHYKGDFEPEGLIRTRQNYSALVENIDRNVGLYLKKLEELVQ